MLFGVSLTSAVSAGVILAAIPATVALLSRVFLHEPISGRTWTAIALAAAGIGMLAFARPAHGSPQAQGGLAWLGNLLVLGAVLCEAAYAVIGKTLTGALGPKRITALINLWGFLLVTPLGLDSARQFDVGAVSAGSWLLLLFDALAASVWTVWLWMTGLKVVPAAQAGVFTALLPVSAAVVGVAVLGEQLTTLQMLAFLAALAGVLLATAPVRGAAR